MSLRRLAVAVVLSACPALAHADGYRIVPVRPIEIKLPGDADYKRITEATAIVPGTSIHTRNGACELRMPDGSRILMAPFTEMDVQDLSAKNTFFNLFKGHLRAAIAGLFTSKLAIQTPTAVAAVRGTEFDITAGGGEDHFQVADGALEVSDKNNKKAMVTSEETLTVDQHGVHVPQPFGLTGRDVQPAARPFVVKQESARDATKTLFAELRNHELQANEAQLGKSVIDAHGNRVRLEEYLLRPDADSFKFLFLSNRKDKGTLDWGSYTERFATALPNDLSNVPALVQQTFLSATQPTNWLKSVELYLTNTIDIFDETITLGDPVLINFAGLPGIGAVTNRWYPGSILTQTFLGGPGIPSGVTLASNGMWLINQTAQDYNTSNAGMFTWTQSVINNARVLTTLEQAVIDPADTNNSTDYQTFANGGLYLVDKAALTGGFGVGGCTTSAANCNLDATVNPTTTITSPSGPTAADQLVSTRYADGTTNSVEKFLVANDGKLIDLAPGAALPKAGDFNMEFEVGSNIYQANGGKIDVLIAPEIFQQTALTHTPDQLTAP